MEHTEHMRSEAGNCCRRKPAGSVFELGRASFECDGDKSAGENDLLREENTRPREHTVLRRDVEARRTAEHRLSTHHAGSLDLSVVIGAYRCGHRRGCRDENAFVDSVVDCARRQIDSASHFPDGVGPPVPRCADRESGKGEGAASEVPVAMRRAS